ncbi:MULTISPECIES: FliM/FliN family flagellar motor switch protein [Pseudomonas]|jgi:flagellar motor switch protein FliN|uniref:Flagellar motor switch protein FliN n=2 Tax=Pseudomonas TaxID=286 RepID=A0A9Q5AX13_PSEFR|nr:FliM/FliN family flagellar motor switch protein [Pseudomonas fragi]ARQ74632.1 flagellar motor switch protein FliN [Pseudomonas fragi]MBM1198461.1 flagellar motor switch protein FliN [Pseudomonas fragi]MBM1207235.1 flagellar motor switch protein FliN [Pseudomonas fragi]NNA84012.1 flagellar motor switch protein FliN [Pseudomonas fragi]NNB01475.1 flagellar motor switch protein FliN [Pseudomonas fragi]
MNNSISDSDFDNLLNDTLPAFDDDSDMPANAPAAAPLPQQDLKFFGKIPVTVTLEVASTEISLRELMDVDTSSVIALDKLAGAPLDVKVNGALFAKAEVVVVHGNYGLRIVELSGSSLSDLAL